MPRSLVIVDNESNDPTVLDLNGCMVKEMTSPDDDPNMVNPIITLYNNQEGYLTVQIHGAGSGTFIAVEYVD